jgi:hypothetical protein
MNIRSIKKKINSGLLTPKDLTIFFTKKQKHKDKIIIYLVFIFVQRNENRTHQRGESDNQH